MSQNSFKAQVMFLDQKMSRQSRVTVPFKSIIDVRMAKKVGCLRYLAAANTVFSISMATVIGPTPPEHSSQSLIIYLYNSRNVL